ncbi:ankyrin repeat domain-containing protein [Legionella waltersii]|nr:ankyrin repeat domain-containing protein [Legionella waltersii]
MKEDTNYWLEQLKIIGVKPWMLKSSKINSDLYQLVFQRLKTKLRYVDKPLDIKASWQLKALTAELSNYPNFTQSEDPNKANLFHYAAWSGSAQALDWVNNNTSISAASKDDYNELISHYAALSGRVEALKWIQLKHPQLLDLMCNNKRNIAHYSAWSGNLDALKWVHEKAPHLMSTMDAHGCLIAHYVAWSGNTESLDWIKTHYPSQLQALDNSGLSLAHFAAWSGNEAALQWVIDNIPNLMTQQDKAFTKIVHYASWSGNTNSLRLIQENYPWMIPIKRGDEKTIIHFGLWSGNKAQVNNAFALSGHPTELKIASTLADCNFAIQTLCRALETNYSLTKVSLPKGTHLDVKTIIDKYLERNMQLKLAVITIKTLFQGLRQPQSGMHGLFPDVLFEVFKKLLPGKIDEQHSLTVFNRIKDKCDLEPRPSLFQPAKKPSIVQKLTGSNYLKM